MVIEKRYVRNDSGHVWVRNAVSFICPAFQDSSYNTAGCRRVVSRHSPLSQGEAQGLECSAYLRKPFEGRALLEAIRRALNLVSGAPKEKRETSS
jgi:hypothetical protein